MKILFVCKYNRFRSRIAEAIFNKLNENPKNKAKSAGIIIGTTLDKKQVSAANKIGININGKPQGISSKLLDWQNIIVIVANDVPTSIFKNNSKYGKHIIVWNIPDTKTDKKDEIKKVIKLIDIKVRKFVNEIK